MVLKKIRGYLIIKSIEYLDKIAINGHYISLERDIVTLP